MYIVIAGAGIVGRNLTQHLSKEHDVIVIDKEKEQCEKIYSNYGAVAINGDATNISILKEAKIQKADYAIAAMRYDKHNLLFSILAKNFNVENIFVRMRDPAYREAYEIAGATNIGHSVKMMVDKFILDIVNPEIRTVASLRNGKAEISIFSIPKNAKCSGQTISEIASNKKFPNDTVIAGIFDSESDKFIVPRGDRKIYENNQIFLVGTEQDIQKAYKFLKKKKIF
ncbi:MAG: potassium channel family protein [Bacillota bacterium]